MDPVLYWNDVALEIQRRDFTVGQSGDSMAAGALSPEVGGPTRVSRALAMVHIAIYEAVAHGDPGSGLAPFAPMIGGTPTRPTTAPAGPGAGLTSFVAGAVGGAAAAVLSDLWRRQSGHAAAALAAFPVGASAATFQAGVAYGAAIGKAVLDWRYNDGSQLVDDMTFSMRVGKHRPDPFSPGQQRLSTNWGSLRPFAIAAPAAGTRIDEPYLDPPPDPQTPRYLDAVQDVMRKGAATSTTRTADQTVEGIFWGYDGPRGLGVPPRLYNQLVRAFMAKHLSANSIADNARLLALVNAGMGDAAIVAWSAKYSYDLWRPVVGIREHDAGFGPDNGAGRGANSGFCDPSWAPLGRPATNTPGELYRTPDFPAYPSGHATFGAVACRMAALFAAEKLGITTAAAMNTLMVDFVSDEYNGVNMDPKGDIRPLHIRTFSLAQAIIQNALSRVWLGVHWRYDGLGAQAPADLESPLPTDLETADPATPDPALDETRLGGVPAGLAIAREIFARHFTPPPTPVPPRRMPSPPPRPVRRS